ncbi:MAG: aldo/keto reductase [Oscillospiraceae bacterium]|nr:aldo/keto reductase [Oscillospiraceae bacterium]MDO5137121.1 aldo/keto reductase [Oscillospiraceae bacterium]
MISDLFSNEKFRLGFGLMRLPKLEDGKTIDVEQMKTMVDMFIEAGGTYFDTAYVYDGGGSERAAKEALVDRYPRDKFTLATKLNARAAADEESAKQQFFTSLERTGAGYFDYYLLHAISRENYETYEKYHLWDFVKEQKAKGLIKHQGFSFHGDPELLEELLTKHPEVEFVQLQINYADWENPGVQAHKNYDIVRKFGKGLTVMEPIKGGALANPLPSIQEIFREANPDASFASWAVRYVASKDGLITVLSGMSNIAQMADNLSYMKDFKPLSEEEEAVIAKAQEALLADKSIPCTACHYCTEGCPMSIPIPEIFGVKNHNGIYPSFDGGKGAYRIATQGRGKASDCLQCGQCESVCPQHLPIIKYLEECRSFE